MSARSQMSAGVHTKLLSAPSEMLTNSCGKASELARQMADDRRKLNRYVSRGRRFAHPRRRARAPLRPEAI